METEKTKNPAAVELGRLGGKARAAALTAARRAEISRLAVMSRQVHKGWPKGKKRTASGCQIEGYAMIFKAAGLRGQSRRMS